RHAQPGHRGSQQGSRAAGQNPRPGGRASGYRAGSIRQPHPERHGPPRSAVEGHRRAALARVARSPDGAKRHPGTDAAACGRSAQASVTLRRRPWFAIQIALLISVAVTLTKFIAGEPMKPATNLLAGWL